MESLQLLLLRVNDSDMKYINSYVLSTLHEKLKIKIYIITKKEQLKCENRKSLNNMDMLRKRSKVLKQKEKHTNKAALYTYKYSCTLSRQNVF
jgi:hypothetical protein